MVAGSRGRRHGGSRHASSHCSDPRHIEGSHRTSSYYPSRSNTIIPSLHAGAPGPRHRCRRHRPGFSVRTHPKRATRHTRRLPFLEVGNSRIGPTTVAATAAFLSELVPCLTTLTAWSGNVAEILPDPVPHPSSNELLWRQVSRMYGQLTLHEQNAIDWYSWKGFNPEPNERKKRLQYRVRRNQRPPYNNNSVIYIIIQSSSGG
ncbi:hypothetical protein DFH07DRAFT_454796 [Mycena maculata]|uniref:Uncharacterized protein n=1 Tax=Mycena maculata TaxID=230809 RepID=A0AAD7NFJ0_9AGAR|nr:hypothetical protein DFH07DRAFT_454796 [Mycena maculata]